MQNALLAELISLGSQFNFQNHRGKNYASGETFSKATPELLSWVARIEDFVINTKPDRRQLYMSWDKKATTGEHPKSELWEEAKIP
ncbi:hypothetical protein [Dyadobacter chenhuakuii]|jgi:hypothetical protein|uniref:Uncharacterized protein n=1 Tax=Dyadobacter chenhuakuii TaxID=2909339 RepID=A0A9X1Q9F8_9BACT|nr:hypothetical protein [Dyadobacter chenhuakuii]MCF2496756.1 hypothetical protein [Dyadobacter chenhuakuii]